jgi:hypothetical protein
MQTKFVELDIPCPNLAAALPQQIEHELLQWGEPLRWAITSVDTEQQMVHVEAIVTLEQH